MHWWVNPSEMSPEGLWWHRLDLGVSFPIRKILVDPRGGASMRVSRPWRDTVQAIVANLEEFGESGGELGEAQGRGSQRVGKACLCLS